MKTKKSLIRPIVLLSLTLLCLLIFSACSLFMPNTEESNATCETFLDHLFADRPDEAYAMFNEIVSADEFTPLWRIMRSVVSDATSYEYKQIGWNTKLSDGITTSSVTYEIVTDNEKTVYLEFVTVSSAEGLVGMHFLDSTPFLEQTAIIPIANIGFIVFSIAMTAFVIWMIVDCARRSLRKKGLWILLILLGASGAITVGASLLKVSPSIGILLMLSSITRTAVNSSITVRVCLPIGAIVYFFLRKSITVKPLPDPIPMPGMPFPNVAPMTPPYTVPTPAPQAPTEAAVPTQAPAETAMPTQATEAPEAAGTEENQPQ